MKELEKAFRRWRKEFPDKTRPTDINAFAAGWEAAMVTYRRLIQNSYELRATIATLEQRGNLAQQMGNKDEQE